jgi:hypothetical protein
MRICYQPTQDSPADWVQTTADQWAGLGSFTCHALCVQGVVFDGADHYSVETVSPGVVRVVVWYDDPTDWPPGQRWARVWTFRHLAADPDPRYGGAVRPQHQQVLFAEDGMRPILEAAYGTNPTIQIRPWNAFNSRRSNPMHGAWVTDEQHADQQAVQSVQGWRTWTEGLHPNELDANGHVRVQRRMARYRVPRGTRTYYHNPATATTPVVADFSNALQANPSGATLQTSGNVGGNGRIVWSTVTPSGEPNSAGWPTTGEYRYQLDVTAAGVDLTFGLLNQGNDAAHFSRISSDASSELQTIQQDEAAFSGSGLHLATITDPAWTAGSSGDRWGFTVAGVRVTGHGNQTFTMQIGESDDFTDGPWTAAPAGPAHNATFFGTSF